MFKEKVIELKGGIKINYAEAGKGPETIIFIHGLAGVWQVWAGCMGSLHKKYHCLAIELPGCGKSSRGEHSYTMQFYADVVADFAEQAGIENYILCGHSMGGQVAIHTALKYPRRVSRLILAAPSGVEVYSNYEQVMFQSMSSMTNINWFDKLSLGQTLQQSFYTYDETAEKIRQFILDSYKDDHGFSMVSKKCIISMMAQPILDKLSELNIPVLILFGENDQFIPNRVLHPGTTKGVADEARRRLKKGQVHLIPDCGHFIHVEKAEEMSKYIKEFI